MNVGDKIYCINSRDYDGHLFNIKGNTYTILKFKSDDIGFLIGVSCHRNCNYPICYYRYNFKPTFLYQRKDYYLFEDYFLNLKEHRKQKLKKITT